MGDYNPFAGTAPPPPQPPQPPSPWKGENQEAAAAPPPPPPPPPPVDDQAAPLDPTTAASLAAQAAEDPAERSERSRQVAAENKRKRKLNQNRGLITFGGFGLSKSAVKAKGKHGKLVKAFSADSDDEDGGDGGQRSGATAGTTDGPRVAQSSLTAERQEEIDRTADWLNQNPDKEDIILENSRGNAKFSFLFEPNSAEGQYYLKAREELRLAAEVKAVCSGGPIMPILPNGNMNPQINSRVNKAAQLMAAAAAQAGPPTAPLPPQVSQAVMMAAAAAQASPASGVAGGGSQAVTAPSGKRSRWGAAPTPDQGILMRPAPPVALPAQPEDSSKALPEVMDEAALKQLRDQKQMQLLEQRVREAAKAQAFGAAGAGTTQTMALHQERTKAYAELAALEDDSKDTIEDAEATGGVIEGGTWEHRKRAKEMLASANSALELTLMSKGVHHLNDYLPKEEMEKFLKNAEAKAAGKEAPAEGDFEKNKLDASNVGFQMLQNAGWKEGQGLGAAAQGAVNPVDMRKTAGESAGLGVAATHEVDKGDDEFDQYRKRMMLAYRFRPNPLNNPRRSYY